MIDLEKINPDRFRYLLGVKRDISNLNITEEVIIDNNYHIENKELTINNCTFDFEFQLTGHLYNHKLIFTNCIFHQRFLATNLDIENLQFIKCTFNQYIASKKLIAKQLIFEFCQFNLQKELVLDQFKVVKLQFTKNEFSRDIQLIPQIANLVILSGGESNSTLTLSNRGNKNIIDKLFVEFNSNHKTDFVLRNLNINYAQFHGELKDATFSINDLKLQVGVLKYFSNQGNMLVNSIIPKSEKSILVLKGVNLGKSIISSIDFSKFFSIQVSNSNLIDIVPVNIVWCDSKTLKPANTLHDRKETYRQLKIVADKNSDIPTKLLYHKYEMRAYLKILKNQRGKFVDKFILRTNQISNNHGLNWLVALMWLIGLSILWYTLVKYSLGQTEFTPELIGSEIGRFISFINPAHYFDKVFYTNSNIYESNALLFDGLSRITGAYLLYQLVSAFRKYSKR